MTTKDFEAYTEELLTQIGIAIKEARGDMPQIDLATAVDLNRSYLSEVENGRTNPTVQILAAICNELGISLTDLIRTAEKAASK